MLDDVAAATERRQNIDKAKHLRFEMFIAHRKRHQSLIKASFAEGRFGVLVDQAENFAATLLDMRLERPHGISILRRAESAQSFYRPHTLTYRRCSEGTDELQERTCQ
jgi:hypothetical protein